MCTLAMIFAVSQNSEVCCKEGIDRGEEEVKPPSTPQQPLTTCMHSWLSKLEERTKLDNNVRTVEEIEPIREAWLAQCAVQFKHSLLIRASDAKCA